jgi:hypothetical protein
MVPAHKHTQQTKKRVSELTARKAVSFQTALSKSRFALFPTKIGDVGIASIKF